MTTCVHARPVMTYDQMSGSVFLVDWATRRDLWDVLYQRIPDYSSLRAKISNIDATPIQKGALFLNKSERAELVGHLRCRSTRVLDAFRQCLETAQSQAASSLPPPVHSDPGKYGYLLAIDLKSKHILRNRLLTYIAKSPSLREKLQNLVINEEQRNRLILNESERAELLTLLPDELRDLKEKLEFAQLQPLKLIDKAPPSFTLPTDEELEEDKARFKAAIKGKFEEQKRINDGFFPAGHFFIFPVHPLDGRYCCVIDGSVVKSSQRKWFVAPNLRWRWVIPGRKRELYYTSA